MMRFMSQTVRPFENANFSTDDRKWSWCVMALSDAHNDVRMSIFPKCQVRGPKHS